MIFLGILLLLVTTVTLVLLLFPVELRINRVKYLAQMLSFPILLVGCGAIGTLVAFVFWLATGSGVWGAETLLLLVYTVAGTVRTLRLGLKNDPPESTERPDLTVLGWNTLGDSVPVDYLVDAILLQQPDAVGLPETTRAHQTALVAALAEAGYPMTGYTVGPQDGHDPHETSLLIRESFGDYTFERLHVLGASTLEATPTNPRMPTFVAVHTVAPRFSWHASWVADLRMLANRYRGRRNTVLVGDFNATYNHMQGFGSGTLGGLQDAAAAVGGAAYATWPGNRHPLLGTQIDHVLTTPDYKVSAFRVLNEYDDSGSDHRAVVATLNWRG